MAYWLLKTEPGDYSFADLVRDKKTVWDGVSSNPALVQIRKVKKGDTAFIYHTGKERAVVGTAEVTKDAYLPKGEDKRDVFDIKAGTTLARPVTLAEIKADDKFADWPLVKMGRLSVVPTTRAQFDHVVKLSKKPANG